MQNSSSRGGVTDISHQLSTQTSLFSTQCAHALQVRDLFFVNRTRPSTYHGTGADSRVGLASAPAIPMQVAAVPMLQPPYFLSTPRLAAFQRPSLSCSRVSVTV
jgi:hypothetical protein